MLAPYDTAINKLKIKGSGHVQEQICRELNHSQWPRVPHDSWVFVRQIKAKATHEKLSDKIVTEVDDCLTHNKDANNVMRFNSLVELLASLLIDLTRGSATKHWYWQHWGHLFDRPKAQAITELLTDNITLINAITHDLSKRQALGTLWSMLQPAQAEQLIREIASKTQFHLPDLNELNKNNTNQAITIKLPDAIKTQWQSILIPLALDDPRRHLGLLLIAQSTLPIMLMHAPIEALQSITETLSGNMSYTTEQGPKYIPTEVGSDNFESMNHAHSNQKTRPSTSEHPENEPATPKEHEVNNKESEHVENHSPLTRGNKKSTDTLTNDLSENFLNTGSVSADNSRMPIMINKRTRSEKNANPTNTLHPLNQVNLQTQTAKRQPDHFYTNQGGIFFLLNFINRAEIQTIVHDAWQELPNGWIWLYRIAQHLNLNEQDPITGFIAQQLQLESTSELEQLPHLPETEKIMQCAELWYGKQKLWQNSLLNLTARVHHNSSHIDIFSPLSAVNIDIRLTGLDINPGWLPWLGRVVQFHYETEAV